jgi:phospholipase C
MFADKYVEQIKSGRIVLFDQYFADLAAGTLPQVAFVEPGVAREAYDANDEHPPAVMQIGQRWAAEVIDALMKSSSWERSAMFITYDEHGGLYDHVVPPPACAPDAASAEFDNLGIRVPFMVVSPYAKKHHVSHRVYDHTSIVRFVEARFVMPALTGRDANAEAPWDMFDFANPPHVTPPAFALPEVDADKLAACAAIFEP